MITKNFKALLAIMLNSEDTNGRIAATNVSGATRYLGPYFGGSNTFPYQPTNNVVISGSNPGIWVGSGDTPATENDYALETRITSGLTSSTPIMSFGADSNDNPYRQYIITLNNITASDIIVKEIAYVQNLRQSSTLGSGAYTNELFMFDRTILEAPLTVPANDTAVIKYVLKCII